MRERVRKRDRKRAPVRERDMEKMKKCTGMRKKERDNERACEKWIERGSARENESER